MDLIGDLLRAGLLEKLGDDPERAGKVRAASRTLASDLRAGHRTRLPEALVSALASGDDGSPLLRDAEQRLVEQWETFPNAFSKRPVALLRAVLIAAVAIAADKEETLKQAAWYTLRTIREEASAERWEPVISDLARSWESEIDAGLHAVWAPEPASVQLRMPRVTSGARPEPGWDLIRVAEQLAADHPSYNQFSTALSEALPGYIRRLIEITEAVGTESVELTAEQLRQAFKSLGKNLREALAAHERVVNASRLRIDLLWWRQSGYSPRLACPYSDLANPADVAAATALDLHTAVGPNAPVAVEHLLADVVADAAGSDDVEVGGLAECDQWTALQKVLDPAPEGAVMVPMRAGSAPRFLGDRFPATRLAVLLFRDLQVVRLLGAGGAP